MRKFVVCGIQMNVKAGDINGNLRTAIGLTEKALKFKPNLIVFPEMFATGFAYPYITKIGKEYFNELLAFMTNLAYRVNAYVVGGSVPEISDGKLFNTSFVISPDRKLLGYFRKAHPFPETDETKYFTGGDNTSIIDSPIGKMGINICYDIRFPELARKMTLEGAEILIVPAQFPHPREHHWKTLLRARAIEDQIFVIGVNRVGGNKPVFFGHSTVIDPYGEILEELGEKEDVLVSEIDLSRLDEVRKAMPVLDDRRPEVYQ